MFPFDAEVLAASYAIYNEAVWPAQPVALALALAALWLAVAPRAGGARLTGAVLAAGWLWCGIVFHLRHFVDLDFMAPVYGWVFILQAALLVWAMVWRGVPLCFRGDVGGVGGLAVAVFALFGLPLVSALGEAGFASARVVGVAPGPTALFTLGLLLLVEGRLAWLLWVIPLLWCAVAGVTAWALGVAEAWPLPVLAGATLVLAFWKPRRAA
jgi:hypothetical protein